MNKLKIIIMTIACLAIVRVFAGVDGYQVGDEVENFKLQNVDDAWVSLEDYGDAQGAIVIFTCNHCPYAKAYEDRIIALHKEFGPKGFPVIAINPNDPTVYEEDSFENMQKRAKEKNYTFPYLFDAEQSVFPVFGATRTPHIFILDHSSDQWTVEYIGAIDNNYEDASAANKKYVEDAVNALIKGKKPKVTETKAIGCSIKVKK